MTYSAPAWTPGLPHQRRPVVEFDDAALFAFKRSPASRAHRSQHADLEHSVDFSQAELHDYLAPPRGTMTRWWCSRSEHGYNT